MLKDKEILKKKKEQKKKEEEPFADPPFFCGKEGILYYPL